MAGFCEHANEHSDYWTAGNLSSFQNIYIYIFQYIYIYFFFSIGFVNFLRVIRDHIKCPMP